MPVFVDEILVDLGAWKAYDDAQREIAGRYDAIGLPTAAPLQGAATRAAGTHDHEHQADELAELEDRLEQQRERDWAEYGQALKANVEGAAARLPGLRVPVVVTVDLDTFRVAAGHQDDIWRGVAVRVLEQAIEATPPFPETAAPHDRLG